MEKDANKLKNIGAAVMRLIRQAKPVASAVSKHGPKSPRGVARAAGAGFGQCSPRHPALVKAAAARRVGSPDKTSCDPPC